MNTNMPLETLLKAILNYDKDLTSKEAAPTGDDYNAVLDIAMQYTPDETVRQHYHLVFAEVIFQTSQNSRDIQSYRSAVFTKAPDLLFPSRRLAHIQNSAALQVREEAGNPRMFKVHNVHILSMQYLGQFTDVEFYAGIQKEKIPDNAEIPVETTENTVIPFKPN